MNQIILIGIAAVVVTFFHVLVVLDRQYRRRMIALSRERSGESIGQFLNSLHFPQLDLAVVRHVYEEFQRAVSFPGCAVPIRATDHLTRTFSVGPDELVQLMENLAQRCGRSLCGYERPHFPRLHTVGDLVRFLCTQPRAGERAE